MRIMVNFQLTILDCNAILMQTMQPGLWRNLVPKSPSIRGFQCLLGMGEPAMLSPRLGIACDKDFIGNLMDFTTVWLGLHSVMFCVIKSLEKQILMSIMHHIPLNIYIKIFLSSRIVNLFLCLCYLQSFHQVLECKLVGQFGDINRQNQK